MAEYNNHKNMQKPTSLNFRLNAIRYFTGYVSVTVIEERKDILSLDSKIEKK